MELLANPKDLDGVLKEKSPFHPVQMVVANMAQMAVANMASKPWLQSHVLCDMVIE
jgi:hypothetical protein